MADKPHSNDANYRSVDADDPPGREPTEFDEERERAARIVEGTMRHRRTGGGESDERKEHRRPRW